MHRTDCRAGTPPGAKSRPWPAPGANRAVQPSLRSASPSTPRALGIFLCICAMGVLLFAPSSSDARNPGGGAALRQARAALAEKNPRVARPLLESLIRNEPETARGLEATLLLADLEFCAQHSDRSGQLLQELEGRFQNDALRGQVRLMRGWIALARGESGAAANLFRLAKDGSLDPTVGQAAEVGIAWARMGSKDSTSNLLELRRVAHKATDPTLRFAAAFTLSKAYIAADKPRAGLRELRALRKRARGTPYADDLELQMAITQMEFGQLDAAKNTLRRLERNHPAASNSRSPLQLDDLRLAPSRLPARLAELYIQRERPWGGPLVFLATALDRDASADVPAARRRVESARNARKEA